MTDDDDLRKRLAQLRTFDAESAPSFDSIWAQSKAGLHADADRRPRPERRPVLAFAFAFAAAAVVAIWISGSTRTVDEGRDWSAGQWATPTDVLLDLSSIPGDRVLRELPSIEVLPVKPHEDAQNDSMTMRISA